MQKHTKESLMERLAKLDNGPDSKAVAIETIAELVFEMLDNQRRIADALDSVAASLEKLSGCVIQPNENFAVSSFQTFNSGQ